MGLFSRKSQYQKNCEAKIEELCGGFFYNDNYEKRLRMHNRTTKTISHDRVKSVLEHECEDGKLALEDIESRLDELLDLDCNTLDLKIRMTGKQDTSKFKTQEDIDMYMGPEYAKEYRWKMEETSAKTREKFIKDEGLWDFDEGVSVNLITPEFGLKINETDYFQTAGLITEVGPDKKLFLTTLMQVVDSKIIFKKAVEGGGDLEIPIDSILSVERADDDFIDINLERYQKIQIKFALKGGYSRKEKNEYLEDQFFKLIRRSESRTIEEEKVPEIVPDNSSDTSNADELLKLVEMFQNGYLTQEEFFELKSKMISSKVCPECKTQLSESDTFCPQCGRSI